MGQGGGQGGGESLGGAPESSDKAFTIHLFGLLKT